MIGIRGNGHFSELLQTTRLTQSGLRQTLHDQGGPRLAPLSKPKASPRCPKWPGGSRTSERCGFTNVVR